MAAPEIRQVRKSIERYCIACYKVKPKIYFNESPIPEHTGYLPICRNCCNALYKKYNIELKSPEAAVWLILARMNIPFFYDIYEASVQAAQGKATTPIISYCRQLGIAMKEKGLRFNGFEDSSNMLTDFTFSDAVESEKKRIKRVTQELKEQMEIWGKFVNDKNELDKEAYDFLNKEFNEYTAELLEMDTNLSNRYRDLCRCEWRLRKANESGDGAEISKAQDALNKQLKLLNLDAFEANRKSEQEKFIDRIAWMIEETEPAEEEDLEKYRDIAGYESAFANIMRSLKNLLCGTRDFPEIPEDER